MIWFLAIAAAAVGAVVVAAREAEEAKPARIVNNTRRAATRRAKKTRQRVKKNMNSRVSSIDEVLRTHPHLDRQSRRVLRSVRDEWGGRIGTR